MSSAPLKPLWHYPTGSTFPRIDSLYGKVLSDPSTSTGHPKRNNWTAPKKTFQSGQYCKFLFCAKRFRTIAIRQSIAHEFTEKPTVVTEIVFSCRERVCWDRFVVPHMWAASEAQQTEFHEISVKIANSWQKMIWTFQVWVMSGQNEYLSGLSWCLCEKSHSFCCSDPYQNLNPRAPKKPDLRMWDQDDWILLVWDSMKRLLRLNKAWIVFSANRHLEQCALQVSR